MKCENCQKSIEIKPGDTYQCTCGYNYATDDDISYTIVYNDYEPLIVYVYFGVGYAPVPYNDWRSLLDFSEETKKAFEETDNMIANNTLTNEFDFNNFLNDKD